jgi:nucleoside-diphosphate-sugar epimerase
VTRASIKFLSQNLDFSIEKAKRVLNYSPRDDFQSGMQQALQWAQSQGQMGNRA